MIHFRKIYLGLFFTLSACGGSSSDSANDNNPSEPPIQNQPKYQVSATFVKGPVSGGRCTLASISSGELREPVATAETDDVGFVDFGNNIQLQGDVLITCSGGRYVDEFTERQTNQDTSPMRMMANLSGDDGSEFAFTVSPLTEIAVQLAVEQGGGLNSVINGQYYQKVTMAFGLNSEINIATLKPLDLITKVAGESSPEAEYGFTLALIAYLHNHHNEGELYQRLAKDLATQLSSDSSVFSENVRQQIGEGADYFTAFGSIINSALQGTNVRRMIIDNAQLILPEADPIKTTSIIKEIEVIRQELVNHIRSHNLQPLADAPLVTDSMFELGQALAFDKILSGNKDTSCMSCHHPLLASGDARALSLGAGGQGLGQNRTGGEVIARHAQPLFNLDLFKNMFWDGRVQMDDQNKLSTPADATGDLTPEMEAVFFANQAEEGFQGYGVVAAQAMFPVADTHEMRGEAKDGNELAGFDAEDFTEIWQGLMTRLGNIPQYVEMFETAYPGVEFKDMTFAHAANAIAAFEIRGFDFRRNPWQAVIADVADNGELNNPDRLDEDTTRGAHFFFETGCVNCHKGAVMSDFDFHSLSVAQFGPGKGDGNSGFEDFGRERITGNSNDRAKFRTAPLFNVALTAPYAHLGQFSELWSHTQTYAIPERFWINLYTGYDRILAGFVHQPTFEDEVSESEKQLLKTFPVPSFDGKAYGFIRTDEYNQTKVEQVVADSGRLTLEEGKRMGDGELGLHRQILVPFMNAQTDPRARDLSHLIPDSVPSGLAVENSLEN
ncbi:hypothetical protein D5018_09360 [Parashewanella curva]|uniref:Di-haem cytochrome c peroxidase domain-containing protein n=1 Tax=Parashewanella curva TaxID=2338552 RepID=A0A3L8Q0T3_9GAMM|nr:cytochrome c peroxidase [Parashewanella curva]RLV60002.1 hypothetical protein D5018_09360 [Parashewanella curva]